MPEEFSQPLQANVQPTSRSTNGDVRTRVLLSEGKGRACSTTTAKSGTSAPFGVEPAPGAEPACSKRRAGRQPAVQGQGSQALATMLSRTEAGTKRWIHAIRPTGR